MQRFQIFWHNLQQDLKIFLYFIILFSVFLHVIVFLPNFATLNIEKCPYDND